MDNPQNCKIALVSSSFPPYGGGGITAAHYNLFRMFRSGGYHAKVFTFGDDGVTHADSEGVCRSGSTALLKKIIYYLIRINALLPWRYRKYIGEQTLDILFSLHGSFRMQRKIDAFSPDVVIVPDHGCPGFWLKKKKGRMNVLISHHNSGRFLEIPFFNDVGNAQDIANALYVEKLALKKIDKVVCPSRYMQHMFVNTYSDAKETCVIPNTVDDVFIRSVPEKDIRKVLGLREDALILYMPSAGSVFKGKQFIVDILRRLSRFGNIGFYLSGDIPEDLREKIRSISGDLRIFAPGHLGYSDNIAVVKACSIVASPTLVESFGMAMLEGMFCSLPVVAFNVGGVGDVVEHERNGVLVQPGNIESFIGAVEMLIKDRPLRKSMGRYALEASQRKFSQHALLRQYQEFLGI